MIGPRFPCKGIPSMGGGPPGIADFKHEHMQCAISFAYDAVLFSLGRCTLNHINSVHGSLLMPFVFLSLSLSLYANMGNHVFFKQTSTCAYDVVVKCVVSAKQVCWTFVSERPEHFFLMG